MSADPFTLGRDCGWRTYYQSQFFIHRRYRKIAQISIVRVLPDAMACPTRFSALIHAATMVTAGVLLVVRCNGIFQNAPTAMFIVPYRGGQAFCGTSVKPKRYLKSFLHISTSCNLVICF